MPCKGISVERIAVIGLGYVGLPVAVAFARKFEGVVGFDINKARVAALAAGEDVTGEISPSELASAPLTYTCDEADIADCDVYIVCVPTPVHLDRRPDFGPLRSASATVGRVMKAGAIVVYESTVYPGATEEICGPILAQTSGLRQGVDFKLGYSPERINPGDREHTFERICKVVAGEDEATAEKLADLYGRVVPAGIHRASSLKVAEAAKVIENVQRDLNVALMNEVAKICDRLGVRTHEVLAAAGTKWNFLKFTPGLVGGHCIGVDPYYLTAKAQELGYHSEVILSGRRINDSMGEFIAQKAIRLLSNMNCPLNQARVGLLGITFKENVTDIRNSRVPDILSHLDKFGVKALVHDPMANPDEVRHEMAMSLDPLDAFTDLDALILAVPHASYVQDLPALQRMVRPGGVILDVKSALPPSALGDAIGYWSL